MYDVTDIPTVDDGSLLDSFDGSDIPSDVELTPEEIQNGAQLDSFDSTDILMATDVEVIALGVTDTVEYIF